MLNSNMALKIGNFEIFSTLFLSNWLDVCTWLMMWKWYHRVCILFLIENLLAITSVWYSFVQFYYLLICLSTFYSIYIISLFLITMFNQGHLHGMTLIFTRALGFYYIMWNEFRLWTFFKQIKDTVFLYIWANSISCFSPCISERWFNVICSKFTCLIKTIRIWSLFRERVYG